jgi:hypothetical protein
MSCFDDDELTKEESYPCECGGNITLNTDTVDVDFDMSFWECDTCSNCYEVEEAVKGGDVC